MARRRAAHGRRSPRRRTCAATRTAEPRRPRRTCSTTSRCSTSAAGPRSRRSWSSWSRDGLHLHRDADLTRRGRRLLIENGEPERRLVQGSHRRGPDQGRLLPDAVQHPAEPRAGAPDARHAEAVGPPRSLGGEQTPSFSARTSSAASAAVVGLFKPAPAGGQPPAADETAAQSRAIDTFLEQPDRRADPQQPAGRRQVPRRRMPALAAQRRQRAGEELHRAEPRVQVHRRRRKPPTGSASGSASSASRSKRPKRRCSAYREQNDAISLEDRAEHRRPEAGRPERAR